VHGVASHAKSVLVVTDAPDGAVLINQASVVPRVIVAQPPSMTTVVAAKQNIRIQQAPPMSFAIELSCSRGFASACQGQAYVSAAFAVWGNYEQ
jgi:hypothetical protein